MSNIPEFVSFSTVWAARLTAMQSRVLEGLAQKARLQLEPPPPEMLVNLSVGVLAQVVLEAALRNPEWAETWAKRLGRLPEDSATLSALLASLPAGKEETDEQPSIVTAGEEGESSGEQSEHAGDPAS